MTWTVAAGDAPRATVAAAAERFGLPVAAEPQTHDRLLHLGSDHSLAVLLAAVGPEVAVLHAPIGDSDVSRMFGRSPDPATVMARGSRYPVDLLVAESEAGRFPAIGHVIASRTGDLRLRRTRRHGIALDRDGRQDVVEAVAVVVANAQHVGRRTVAPRAALMDGRAEVQAYGGSLADRLRASRLLGHGLHQRVRGVHRRPCVSVGFSLPARWRLATDGVVVPGREWTVTTLPAAATLWV